MEKNNNVTFLIKQPSDSLQDFAKGIEEFINQPNIIDAKVQLNAQFTMAFVQYTTKR